MVAKPASFHSRRVRENRSLPFGRILFDDRAFDQNPGSKPRSQPPAPLNPSPKRRSYCLLLIPISKIHPGSKARFTTSVAEAAVSGDRPADRLEGWSGPTLRLRRLEPLGLPPFSRGEIRYFKPGSSSRVLDPFSLRDNDLKKILSRPSSSARQVGAAPNDSRYMLPRNQTTREAIWL